MIHVLYEMLHMILAIKYGPQHKNLNLEIPFDDKRDAYTVIIKATWSLTSDIDNFFDSI